MRKFSLVLIAALLVTGCATSSYKEFEGGEVAVKIRNNVFAPPGATAVADQSTQSEVKADGSYKVKQGQTAEMTNTLDQVIADVLKDAIGKFLESDLPSLLFAPEGEPEDVTGPEATELE
jgi:hypothetical protein